VLNALAAPLNPSCPSCAMATWLKTPVKPQPRARHAHAYFLTPEVNASTTPRHGASLPLKDRSPSSANYAKRNPPRQARNRPCASETEAVALTRSIEELTAQLEARSEERAAPRPTRQPGALCARWRAKPAHRAPPAGVAHAGRPQQERAKPRRFNRAEPQRNQRLEAEHARLKPPSTSCRPSLPRSARPRSLQQEAAQVTAELPA